MVTGKLKSKLNIVSNYVRPPSENLENLSSKSAKKNKKIYWFYYIIANLDQYYKHVIGTTSWKMVPIFFHIFSYVIYGILW